MARTKIPQPSANDDATPRNPAECRICGKVLSHKYGMPRHLAVHEKDKLNTTRSWDPAQCELCGKVISRKSDLPRHLRVHERKEMDFCPYTICEYRTLQRSNMRTHIRTHSKEKTQLCPSCDFETSDPGSLTRHRKRFHGYVPKPRRTSGNAHLPLPVPLQASTPSGVSKPRDAETRETTSSYTRAASESSSGSDSSASSYEPPYYPYYGANCMIPGPRLINANTSASPTLTPFTTLPDHMDFAAAYSEHLHPANEFTFPTSML